MPELPEVETVRSDLDKFLKNQKIKKVTVKVANMVDPKKTIFEKVLIGQKIKSIKRRGKMLIFDLTKDFLLAHLKMTGQFVYVANDGNLISGGHTIKSIDSVPNKYSHVIFELDLGMLYFNDLRKFGWFKYVDQKGLDLAVKNFGIEPLSKKFTLQTFKNILQKKPKTKIKQLLLDQKLVAGIGNIYADEINFYAKVLPTRQAKTLTDQEIKKMFTGIKKILQKAVEQRGTSVNTYVDANGRPGSYAKLLKVYSQDKKPCVRCKTIIKKIKVAQRGTHYCPKCQS